MRLESPAAVSASESAVLKQVLRYQSKDDQMGQDRVQTPTTFYALNSKLNATSRAVPSCPNYHIDVDASWTCRWERLDLLNIAAVVGLTEGALNLSRVLLKIRQLATCGFREQI